MCGEQVLFQHLLDFIVGSPPRVRGTAYEQADVFAGYRITPACAGNRTWKTKVTPSKRDHPRVCGEQGLYPMHRRLLLGSPPRVRGTGWVHQQDPHPAGITPACAGNRVTKWSWNRGKQDHPRVCGEQKEI